MQHTLTSPSFSMPPWCNISPVTSLKPWNPSVLHQWCNKHSLANLFLLQATVMQHMSARFPLPPTGHHDATPLQKHLSSLKILLCCIVDATNVLSLTYSSHRPLWCNTPLETSLQPWNPGVLHCWCNKRLLANLFLPRIPPWCNISHLETIVCCINDATNPCH